MRYLLDECVTEIIDIDFTRCTKEGDIETNPDYLMITMRLPGWTKEDSELYEISGEYRLDGSEETFRKAKANMDLVLRKLLVKGWCEDSDFENVDWF